MDGIDPLSEYFVEKYKKVRTVQEQGRYEGALMEMGYWIWSRPANVPVEEWQKVCPIKGKWVQVIPEFDCECPPIGEYEGFLATVMIYKDLE